MGCPIFYLAGHRSINSKGKKIVALDDAGWLNGNTLWSAIRRVAEQQECVVEFPGHLATRAMKERFDTAAGRLHVDVWIIEALLRLLCYLIQPAAVWWRAAAFPSVHVCSRQQSGWRQPQVFPKSWHLRVGKLDMKMLHVILTTDLQRGHTFLFCSCPLFGNECCYS